MNQTQNYQLSQWERSDKVQMEDFNADNAKIDAALTAQASTLSAHAAALSKLSNCRIHLTSYVGNGNCKLENSPRVKLPGVPKVLIVLSSNYLLFNIPESGGWSTILGGGDHSFMGVSWNENTAILEQYASNASAFMNQTERYYVIAIYPAE